jgi:outer membrane lipoprotein SlyB
MKGVKYLLIIFAISTLLCSCAWFDKQTHNTKTGAGIGAVVGGLAGLIIDSHNPWRGGVIGVAIGAVSGGVIGNIIDHSANEAACKNKSVKYQRTTENGTKEEITAKPRSTKNTKNDYKLVTVKYARDGRVVGEEVKKVSVD